MPATARFGPFEGAAGRLSPGASGRLVIDDKVAGLLGVGWVDVAERTRSTAYVRLSSAAVPTDEAVADVVGILIDGVRLGGAERLVLESDDEDGERVRGVVAERGRGFDVVVVPGLRVANSLGRRLERVATLVPGRVGMYSCGPTVYSYQHIGNMRAYVFADTLKRALRWRGFDVRHVVNITDVGHLLADADEGEDKVEEASRREGRSVAEITSHYTDVFWADLRSLNVDFPDEWPRASDYVDRMIDFARVLQDHGYAYPLPGGLYFDTAAQAGYGELAGLDAEGLREGARVDPVEGKRAKTDFAVWRTFTDGRTRLMQWESPWGTGAPGWHLECSVMSMALLGDHFDIHTGGIDHRELHHVNEIAQSEAYLDDGRRWVTYWVHNAFVTFRDEKMSKSSGGTIRLSDLVRMGVHPLAYRYLLLQSHYASPLDYSDKTARHVHVALARLVRRVREALGPAASGPGAREPDPGPAERITLASALDEAAVLGSDLLRERVLALDAAVAADLMTPAVLALVSTWSKDIAAMPAAAWAVLVRAVDTLTGLRLGSLSDADLAPPLPDDVAQGWVEDRIAERDGARAVKDWATADRMRAELTRAGIRVEDTPEGTHWYYAGR